tara:strand:+ start:3327 stop:3677 length:351 start_codon:yes stop_codon:yes gene_type:complete
MSKMRDRDKARIEEEYHRTMETKGQKAFMESMTQSYNQPSAEREFSVSPSRQGMDQFNKAVDDHLDRIKEVEEKLMEALKDQLRDKLMNREPKGKKRSKNFIDGTLSTESTHEPNE